MRIGLARKSPVVASGLRARLFYLLALRFRPSLELLPCGFMEKKLGCAVKVHGPALRKLEASPQKSGDHEGIGLDKTSVPGTGLPAANNMICKALFGMLSCGVGKRRSSFDIRSSEVLKDTPPWIVSCQNNLQKLVFLISQ